MTTEHRQTPHAETPEWLAGVISSWESAGLCYAALRTDESVLRPDSELDILAAPAALAPLVEVVGSAVADRDDMWVPWWRYLPGHAAGIILAWRGPDASWHSFYLDVRCGIHKHGRVLVDASELGRSDTLWDADLGIRRLRDGLDSALLLLRNAIDGRTANARHVRILEARAGSGLGGEIRALGFDDAALANGVVQRRRLAPLRLSPAIRYRLRAVRGRVQNRSAGLNVVFYGPDGVGKSTQADLLAQALRAMQLRRVCVYHAFIEVAALSERAGSKVSAAKRTVYGSVVGRRGSSLLPLLAFFKRVLQIGLRFRPAVRRGGVLIHDRYLVDVFLKHVKVGGARTPGLEKLLMRVTPRSSTLVFLLRGDADAIARRTNELTPDQVKGTYVLLDDCLAFVEGRVPVVRLDVERSPTEIGDEVLSRYLALQSGRFLDAFGPRGWGKG